MVTKLKTVSRHWLTKTTVIILASVFLCMTAYNCSDFVKIMNRGNLRAEGLFETNYLRTGDFKSEVSWRAQIINQLFYDTNEDVKSALAGIDRDNFVYYGKMGDKVFSTGVNEAYFTSGQCEYVKYEGRYAVSFSDGIEPALFEGEYLSFDGNRERTYYEYTEDGQEIEHVVPPTGMDAVIYIGLGDEFVSAQNRVLQQSREFIGGFLREVAVGLFPVLLLTIFLCISAGRSSKDDKLHMRKIDVLYSDVTFVGMCTAFILFVCVAWIYVTEAMLYGAYTAMDRFFVVAFMYFFVIVGFLATVMLLLSLVRKAKNKTLFSHSLIGIVCRGFANIFKSIKAFFVNIFNGKPFEKYYFSDALFRRQRTFLLLSLANVVLFGLTIWAGIGVIFLLFEIYLIYRYTKNNNQIYGDMGKILDQVSEIEQGNMEYNPEIAGDSPLRPCSDKLLNISSGMQKSVEKQMISERTKIDLVTNVSHDLKTPLTSIIGYINLLQKEDLAPEARDYVNILAQKSEKLKHIVSDVFDLAKSTSGNLEMTQEIIDFKKLVEQNMADMEDKIETSGLALRISMPAEPVSISADGKRLTRVLQNVMDNALNYSLQGSRIYVTLNAEGTLTVQNTAGYEMDFTEQEITERFVRGDKNRTEGGSGLGLSIAQSFTAACGGTFSVHVDGDQFKVAIGFSIVESKPAKNEAQ